MVVLQRATRDWQLSENRPFTYRTACPSNVIWNRHKHTPVPVLMTESGFSITSEIVHAAPADPCEDAASLGRIIFIRKHKEDKVCSICLEFPIVACTHFWLPISLSFLGGTCYRASRTRFLETL